MNSYYTISLFLLPLLIVLSGVYRHWKWSLVLASAPVMLASLLLTSEVSIAVDWLLLGSHFGLTATTQWLLPVSALIWLAAALLHTQNNSVVANESKFRLFYLLTITGNLLLLLAQDIVSFYIGFAVMGLAGYGLIMQSGSVIKRVAANTYLRWTIAGELVLFSGLLLVAFENGSTQLPLKDSVEFSTLAIVMVIIGFGIKIGLPGLHAWMPGAYFASSTSGSTVLSGAMANAGILGLLLFLPIQNSGYETAGLYLLTFGLIGAFYGVLLGLPQRQPKVILAYSSMSQLSTLAAMIGLALITPTLAPALVIAITLYSVHHALTKAGLFLALDGLSSTKWRNLSLGVLVLLSLIMAGLPLTIGGISKDLLKDSIGNYSWLVTALSIASIATSLLMARFLFICHKTKKRSKVPNEAAGPIIALALIVIGHIAFYSQTLKSEIDLSGIWPLIIATFILIIFSLLPKSAYHLLQPVIPKGDLPNVIAKIFIRVMPRFSISEWQSKLGNQIVNTPSKSEATLIDLDNELTASRNSSSNKEVRS